MLTDMSLFGAGLNYIGTQETNSANRQLQRETNAMNYQIAQEANQTSRDIAAEQNEWNYRMFNEQNTWNLQQWERENEYNSPKQQVQRYIEAGINPLWAIGNGNPGNAQQLTSAAASPAVGADVNVPTMEAARMQAPDFSSLSGIAQNVINGIQGFQRLKIEQQEANTRSRKADADINLSSTQANYYNSLAEGVNLDNIFNKDTFSTRVQQLQSNLDKTRSEINHLDKDSELYDSKQALLDSQVNLNKAMVTKSQAEIKQTIASIAQRWQEIKFHGQELGIAQQNADTAAGQLKVSQAQFGLAVDKAKAEFQQRSNEEILRYIDSSKGVLGRVFGSSGKPQKLEAYGVEVGYFKGRDFLAEMQAAGIVLSQRYFENPSQDNLNAYLKVYDTIHDLPQPSQPNQVSPSFYNIENPSQSWNE